MTGQTPKGLPAEVTKDVPSGLSGLPFAGLKPAGKEKACEAFNGTQNQHSERPVPSEKETSESIFVNKDQEPPKEEIPSGPPIQLIAETIWNEAYDKLRNDESKKSLVEEFETILQRERELLKLDINHIGSSFAKNMVKWDEWDGMIASIKDAEKEPDQYISADMTGASQQKFKEINAKMAVIIYLFQGSKMVF
ncbi:uncharacterized protein ASPGLDRAFT_25905 [Aspergillus glaucus CBS 516.65]|uniref:Uncharacterized protein n=1 Tax=Aspergillus glaucus CBS 516.65 TaxID=1160497 RepID=A0A1L9VKR5_ASPGL|nr:hypothetical protein ASPGLDRAFT_25905 [Aspergillus glaucus CBS 516.65]OJJ84470.1 hypothetical protein ASPGLDRAFT_25905 [Aspergillus glaucus CBS 516.65]